MVVVLLLIHGKILLCAFFIFFSDKKKCEWIVKVVYSFSTAADICKEKKEFKGP